MRAAPIPVFDVRLQDEEVHAVVDVLRTGRLAAGAEVEAFEQEFAQHVGAAHAVAVNSCTSALELAYAAVGVGPGDEVVVPSITFVATAAAVVRCGATPVFADSSRLDPGIDPDHVASLLTRRTRVVCAMHFGGYPAALGPLAELCEQHGVALIEDSAHAPASRGIGLGAVSCFSFFANKILSCGEGGLLATDDGDLAMRLRRARAAGTGHWMDDLRAALLRARLPRMHEEVGARRSLTRRYRAALAGAHGLEIPYRDDEVERSSCYAMAVLADDAERQVALRRHLRDACGVATTLLYPAVHTLSAFAGAPSLARAEDHAAREVTLPLFGHLTHEEQDRVIDGVLEGLRA